MELFIVPHPGTGEAVICQTFKEAMDKWFEGMNIPVKYDAKPVETFEESYARVKDYLNVGRSGPLVGQPMTVTPTTTIGVPL